MKAKYIYAALLGVLAVLSSCSDKFLDNETNEYLTDERKKELIDESPKSAALLVEGSLNGVYNTLVDNGLNGNTNHDYFGLKSIHLATDLTSEDMVQDKHHHFGFDYNIDNRGDTFRRTRLMWALFYKMVSSSNIILKEFFAKEPESPVMKSQKAKTIALRGIAYYYLVNLYQQTYKGNENAPGVPLLLKPEDENMPREKVSKVYESIVSDLTYAALNGTVTEDKKDADKLVAAAYLAKAYAHMEKWDSVAKYSAMAIEDNQLMPAGTYLGGLGDISNTEWLWGFDINATTSTLYASFYSHIDNTIQGYAGALAVTKSIHNALYNKIPQSDVRKKLFINLQLFPDIAKKYEGTSVYKNYVSIKYQTNANFEGDYCFLRVADPYLLLAEAYAELGDVANAQKTLSDFVKTRNSSYDVSLFATKEQLIEETRFQRRIELWGEGTAFFDFKRWKLGINRTVAGTNHRTKLVVPAGDKSFIYQIPKGEMDANPNIGVQNP